MTMPSSSATNKAPPPPVGVDQHQGRRRDDGDDGDPPPNDDGGNDETYGSSVHVYGSTTSMPDNDYCRLSYYLKCCIIGCGIDFVFDVSLLDYQNGVLNLDVNGQEQLYQLANDVFRADILLNKLIFLDDENILMPQGVSNVFYHVETVSEFIQRAHHAAASFSAGSTTTDATTDATTTTSSRDVLSQPQPQQLPPQRYTRSQKVMLCSTEWLRTFYLEPISRLIDLHRPPQPQHPISPPPIPPSSSDDRGSSSSGSTGDDDDDDDDEGTTSTTPQPSEVISSTEATQVHVQTSSWHCDHCEGLDAACTCTHGCSRSVTRSHCRMIHSFPCNGTGCHKHKILGPRYRCQLCPPPYFNLCKACYRSKTKRQQHHQQQHPEVRDGSSVFELIPRIGSPPAHLVELEGAMYQHHGEHPSNPPHLSIGQTVRLVGIASLPQVTGQEAIVFEVLENRYLVHVPCLSIMLCVQPNNIEHI